MHTHLALIVLIVAQSCFAAGADKQKQLNDEEKVVLFVIRHEAMASAFETRNDVCVSFNKQLSVREKVVLASLHGSGLKFHSYDWCNHGPRGVDITIPESRQESPGMYRLTAESGDFDPIRLYGEHFGTLLRKGVYFIKCEKDSEPEFVKYEQDVK